MSKAGRGINRPSQWLQCFSDSLRLRGSVDRNHLAQAAFKCSLAETEQNILPTFMLAERSEERSMATAMTEESTRADHVAFINKIKVDLDQVIQQLSQTITTVTTVNNTTLHDMTIMKDKLAAMETAGGQGGDRRLKTKEAQTHIPKMWAGKVKGQIPYQEFQYRMENWLSAYDPECLPKDLLNWAASEKEPITYSMVVEKTRALDEEHCNAKCAEINRELYLTLVTCTSDAPATLVRNAGAGNGFLAWQMLAADNRPTSIIDGGAAMAQIIQQTRTKTLSEFKKGLGEWDLLVTDYEARYKETIAENTKTAAILMMMPTELYVRKFEGESKSYREVRKLISDIMAASPQMGRGQTPMELDTIIGEALKSQQGDGDNDPMSKLTKALEQLNAFVKGGKGGGKTDAKGKGGGGWKPSKGKADEKGKSKGGGKGGAPKGGKGTLVCYNCGGVGHPKRLCPTICECSEGNEDKEEEEAEEEHQGETEIPWMCHLEEDDSNWPRDPIIDDCRGPLVKRCSCKERMCGAHRDFTELSVCMQYKVAMEKRREEKRNRRNASRSPAESAPAESEVTEHSHYNTEGMKFGFHLLEEGEEEVQDALNACTEAGWVKITAVVDSGAVDNVLPEEELEFVPLAESERSKSGRGFRGPAGEPIPARGQRTTVVKTAEGQARRTKWQVCPVKRPLMSVAKLTEAGNSVHLLRKSPHILNEKTGEKTALRIEGNVYVVDLWVQKAPSPMPSAQPKKAKSVRWADQYDEPSDMELDWVGASSSSGFAGRG